MGRLIIILFGSYIIWSSLVDSEVGEIEREGEKMRIFQDLLNGFPRCVWMHRCYASSTAIAFDSSFFPNPITPLSSRNLDSSLHYVYPGFYFSFYYLFWMNKLPQHYVTYISMFFCFVETLFVCSMIYLLSIYFKVKFSNKAKKLEYTL